MGKKKNKKKSQKNRQAKSLKKRSQKKTLQKSRPKRKGQQFPGMPGGLPGGVPPGMMGQVEDMAKVTEPLFNIANPSNMPQMQAMVALMQSFYSAFDEQNEEKRKVLLDNTRIAYEKQSWATTPFDEISEQILKRHIFFNPDAHSEEERNRYTEEELKAASETAETEGAEEAQVQLPDVGLSPSILDKLHQEDDAFSAMEMLSKKIDELPAAEVIPDEAEAPAAESEAEPAAEPISEEILSVAEIDGEDAKTFFADNGGSALSEDFAYLKDNYKDIDFIDENNAVLQKTLVFQKTVLDVFEAFLKHKNLSAPQAAAHLQGVRPFFTEYLGEYHQSSILNCDEDQVEEYVMDYFIRKVSHTDDGKKYVLSAFKLFFAFAGVLGFAANAEGILERIDEISEEFEEMI